MLSLNMNFTIFEQKTFELTKFFSKFLYLADYVVLKFVLKYFMLVITKGLAQKFKPPKISFHVWTKLKFVFRAQFWTREDRENNSSLCVRLALLDSLIGLIVRKILRKFHDNFPQPLDTVNFQVVPRSAQLCNCSFSFFDIPALSRSIGTISEPLIRKVSKMICSIKCNVDELELKILS